MFDQAFFLRTLSEFARALRSGYDLEPVLAELTASATAVLGLSGSGVTWANNGRLRFITAVGSRFEEMERVQEQHQTGPCHQAYELDDVVTTPDVREVPNQWPEYAAAARRLGVAGVAGIPMRLGDRPVGVLNLYDDKPRDWSPDDLAAAGVLADVATGYVMNATALRHERQTTQQLQHALDSRVVIEQAKGIIANHHGITVDEAYQRIRRHARSHNANLRVVAEAIVRLGLRV